MTNTITKREFINTLATNRSALLCCTGRLTEEQANKGIDILSETYRQYMPTVRECIARRATYLEFTGGSRLYMNELGECSKKDNLLINKMSWYDDFDKCTYYKVLAYLIIE